MGILNNIKNRFKPSNTVTKSSYTQEELGKLFENSFSNVSVFASNVLKQSSDVFSCINLVASTIAQMNIDIFVNCDKGKERVKIGNLDYLFNVEANKYQSAYDWKFETVSNLLIYGESFCRVVTNSKGEVIALNNLDNSCTNFRKLASGDYVVDTIINNSSITLKYEEVIYHRDVASSNLELRPVSRLDSILTLIENNIVSNDMVAEVLQKKGVTINGIIEVEGNLSPEAKLELKKAFKEALTGDGIGVTTTGVNYKDLSSNSKSILDSHFVELFKMNTFEIAKVFNVNPALIGNSEKINYSNVIEIKRMFLESLGTTIKKFELEIIRKAFTTKQKKAGNFVKFDINSVIRSDFEKLSGIYMSLKDKGILTTNEVRQELGYNCFEDELADEILTDLNHVPLTDWREYVKNRDTNNKDTKENNTEILKGGE